MPPPARPDPRRRRERTRHDTRARVWALESTRAGSLIIWLVGRFGLVSRRGLQTWRPGPPETTSGGRGARSLGIEGERRGVLFPRWPPAPPSCGAFDGRLGFGTLERLLVLRQKARQRMPRREWVLLPTCRGPWRLPAVPAEQNRRIIPQGSFRTVLVRTQPPMKRFVK